MNDLSVDLAELSPPDYSVLEPIYPVGTDLVAADLSTLSNDELDGAIRASFRRTKEEILRLGRLLAEMKRRLPHGEFGPYLESVGIKRSTATYWMGQTKPQFEIANISNLILPELPELKAEEPPTAKEAFDNATTAILEYCHVGPDINKLTELIKHPDQMTDHHLYAAAETLEIAARNLLDITADITEPVYERRRYGVDEATNQEPALEPSQGRYRRNENDYLERRALTPVEKEGDRHQDKIISAANKLMKALVGMREFLEKNPAPFDIKPEFIFAIEALRQCSTIC
jgi:hypothetical protein